MGKFACSYEKEAEKGFTISFRGRFPSLYLWFTSRSIGFSSSEPPMLQGTFLPNGSKPPP